MSKRKHRNLYLIILSWLAVFLWMALIFKLSSQVAEESDQLSTGITEIVVNTVKIIVPNVSFNLISLNQIFRKGAHFFAFFLLGILVISSFSKSGIHKYRNKVLALFVCILYAISDEMHQMFVSGRGPGMKDAVIDSIGAMAGVGFYLLAVKILMRSRMINGKADTVTK